MKLEKTETNTYKFSFKHGELEVNLIPANGLLPESNYCRPAFGGELIIAHDNVGITALKLNDCPPVPRICWDNREHHFWEGYSGGFEPRNTIVNDIRVHQSEDNQSAGISFYYIANFVKVTEAWFFKEPDDNSLVSWDTVFTFENLRTAPLGKYMALFACYHQPGRNYYWNANNEVSACADSFRAHADEQNQQIEREITAKYREQVKTWTAEIKNPASTSVLYGKPMLMSQRREWFKNGQHLFFIEPEKCLSIVSAMGQARDYMLAPANKDLGPQESFSARVRHIIADIRGMDDLKQRWGVFIKDIVENRSL